MGYASANFYFIYNEVSSGKTKKSYIFMVLLSFQVTSDARKKLAIFPCNMAEYASADTEV